MTNLPLPFHCPRCSAQDQTTGLHFVPTDVWIFRYPSERLIHIHFGVSTSTEEESTAETTFVFEHTVAWFEQTAPGQPFCTVVDFTRGDDSESPSDASMDLYKKMLVHPQNSLAIFYRMTPAMGFFLSMLRRFSRSGKHMQVAKTLEEAEALYQAWWKKEQATS